VNNSTYTNHSATWLLVVLYTFDCVDIEGGGQAGRTGGVGGDPAV
jgi:hypothetical protein